IEADEVGIETVAQRRRLERIGGLRETAVARAYQKPPQQLEVGRLVVHQQDSGALELQPVGPGRSRLRVRIVLMPETGWRRRIRSRSAQTIGHGAPGRWSPASAPREPRTDRS